jgi:hypothetical protein
VTNTSAAPQASFGNLAVLACASASRACHSAGGVNRMTNAMPSGTRIRSSSRPMTGMKSGIRSIGLSA